ncbi:MAG: Uma2 family endonuclease [Caldilineaceae bacterium]|mgnify:CR=1 FL=1|nr:Uma2 family endonuclease [Caldilineaceae bacterium]
MVTPIYTLFDTPVKARMSAEDYIASPQSEQKSDLIEGVFVMASPAPFEHEDVQGMLLTTMRLFVNTNRLGVVLGENEVYVQGAPDLAVEIISPSSRQYDSVEKLVNCGRFGVQEYWLVDPIERMATLYGNVNGQLMALPVQEGVLRSRRLPGFWLGLEWIFPAEGAARPSELEIAREPGLI